jgi:hypothetical protein
MQETVNLNVHVKVDDPACLAISEELNAGATEMMKAYNSTNLVNFAGVNDVWSGDSGCARDLSHYGTSSWSADCRFSCCSLHVTNLLAGSCEPAAEPAPLPLPLQAHLTLYMTDFLAEHVDAIKKVYVLHAQRLFEAEGMCEFAVFVKGRFFAHFFTR